MNEYYEELKIGKGRVSKNLEKVTKVVESWSKDKRLAAKVSLKEDISDSENYHQLAVFVAVIINAVILLIFELDWEPISKGTVVGITFILVLIVVFITLGVWMNGRSMIHKYEGLLYLLEQIDQSANDK